MHSLTRTFAALSDDTRLAVVEQLMTAGELPAGALVAGADMSGPAMSRHLKVLREAGLIRQRVDGARRLYSVRPEALQAISDWIIQHRQFWESGLDRLHDLLTQEAPDD
ncbi:metalloregulator ArsR/SmtB family transcription factor [Thalassovita sp.]|uniref:ArsR/SmtB family transcription factor n=1 Tax=Thalassovita sp. TaxID=1979401 RepID=UPI0029DE52D0|nr:metalloregulator ArsR/SmtB family transcription factor [Thalassovita sp.]